MFHCAFYQSRERYEAYLNLTEQIVRIVLSITCHLPPRLEPEVEEGPLFENTGPSDNTRHVVSWGANSVQAHAKATLTVRFVYLRRGFANLRHERTQLKCPLSTHCGHHIGQPNAKAAVIG